MESHTDLARGFVRGDRGTVDALWNELTKILNSHGPPIKDTSAWKKVVLN